MSEAKDGLIITADGGLVLPRDFVTQTQAILAKRGKGKSYAAMVEAEELTKAALPWVAVDGVGVWYGLRAGPRGTKAGGLPVLVLGGLHGDAALSPGAGDVVADFVAKERRPTVLDVSEMSNREQITFVAGFLNRLYNVNRDALHVFLEEADMWAPQSPSKGDMQQLTLGAVDKMIRRGRARGLGSTLISQRPAVIHKNVLTQTEMLVVLGFTAPQDIAAIRAWAEAHGIGGGELEEFLGSLPKLHKGMAWVSSPDWLKVWGRFQIRRKETFDSSATPEAGAEAGHGVPTSLAEVDLEGLKAAMAEAVEAKEASDPAKLRRRVAELEAELAKARAAKPAAAKETVKRVEVPVLKDSQIKAIDQLRSNLDKRVDAAGGLLTAAKEISGELAEAVRSLYMAVNDAKANGMREGAAGAPAPARLSQDPAAAVSRPAPAAAAPTRPPVVTDPKSRDELPGPMRKIIDAYAWWHSIGIDNPSRENIAPLAGYSNVRSSGFRNPLYECHTAGLIDSDALTDKGRALAAWPAKVTSLAEYHAKLKAVMDGPAQKIFDALFAAGGVSTREALAANTGYTNPRSSGFRNPLYRISSMGLVELKGEEIKGTHLMYPAGLA